MSRYIDADALLKEWKIELPKKRPAKGKQSKEFLAFMEKYENHPYYFAILSLYLTEPADVVEVVRCKDCKFYAVYEVKSDGTEDKRCKPSFCDLHRKHETKEYFCADGERRIL